MIILAWTLLLLATAGASILIGLSALRQARREEDAASAANERRPPGSAS